MSRPGLLNRLLTIHLPALVIVLLAVGPFAWLALTALTPRRRSPPPACR